MNDIGKGLPWGSVLFAFFILVGCSDMRPRNVAFTKDPTQPGNSTDGMPQQVTPTAGCGGAITIRLNYLLAGADYQLTSCQELQLQNGTYVIKQSFACSGSVTANNSAISFSGLNHNCNGFVNLGQAGKSNLTCTGGTYDRMEADYVFRTSTQTNVGGVNVVANLCQKASTVTNRSPIILDPGSPSNKEGDSVNLKITASDPDNDPITYAANGLPTGLSMNTSTGIISGTIASGASAKPQWGVTVTVSDNKGHSSVFTFVWAISTNTGTAAFAKSITTSSSGAVVSLSGTVQGLRYNYDSSGGWVNASGPFGSSYTINKTWPAGTTFVCAQAQGTDGLWHGPTLTDTQICNSVNSTPPPPATRTVTATWSANTEGDLSGYIMYYSDVNGNWSRFAPIVVGKVTSLQIPNMTIGKTYYFAVTAFDTANQESAKSNVFTFTVTP